jgi:hypothetical protein
LTAANPFMPESAIATGMVDAILSVDEIVERLVQIAMGKEIEEQNRNLLNVFRRKKTNCRLSSTALPTRSGVPIPTGKSPISTPRPSRGLVSRKLMNSI